MIGFLKNIQRKGMPLLFAVAFLFLLPVSTYAAENISYYEVDIAMNPNSSFKVTETIHYDFGNEEKHGIYRDIPTGHPQKSSDRFKERFIALKDVFVKIDGNSVPFTVKEKGGVFSIKIGDSDQTVTGKHVYTVIYTVYGGLQTFENGTTELYWDAIGSEWDFPIENAVVILRNKNSLLTGKSSCYQGLEGAESECNPAKLEKGDYYHMIGRLATGEGVTVAYKVNLGDISPIILERYVTWYLWPIGIVLLLLVFGVWMYRYKTEFKTGKTIVPQYEPYADFKPMYTGLLFDGRLDPKDITACIVYLAQQGYLQIKKIEGKVFFFFEVDDYEVTLIKQLDNSLTSFQQDVLTLLFDGTFSEGASVTLSDLKTNYSKQKKNQKILQTLKKDLEKDLSENGFYQVHLATSVRNILITLGVIVIVALTFSIIVAIIAGIMILLLLVLSRRRTRKGYEALDYLKGFRQFLSVTETERYKFHNAPQKSPEQFMEYLPYAIGFGVEKQWAEVFEDITIPNPDWYDGGSVSSFSATNLTTSLGAFSTAFASSSGSSGASGGGGSVGGGGGGGGGGSW